MRLPSSISDDAAAIHLALPTPAPLPANPNHGLQNHPGGLPMRHLIVLIVVRRLEAHHWNRTTAAISLGVSIRFVRGVIQRLKEQGFYVPDHPGPKIKSRTPQGTRSLTELFHSIPPVVQ